MNEKFIVICRRIEGEDTWKSFPNKVQADQFMSTIDSMIRSKTSYHSATMYGEISDTSRLELLRTSVNGPAV